MLTESVRKDQKNDTYDLTNNIRKCARIMPKIAQLLSKALRRLAKEMKFGLSQ